MTTPTISQRSLAGLFLVAVVAVALWASLCGTASGDIALLPCPVNAITGIACPGCGITRASVAFTRGHFQEAWDYHPFVYLLIPLALVYWLAPLRTAHLWSGLPKLGRGILIGTVLLASFGLWIARSPWI